MDATPTAGRISDDTVDDDVTRHTVDDTVGNAGDDGAYGASADDVTGHTVDDTVGNAGDEGAFDAATADDSDADDVAETPIIRQGLGDRPQRSATSASSDASAAHDSGLPDGTPAADVLASDEHPLAVPRVLPKLLTHSLFDTTRASEISRQASAAPAATGGVEPVAITAADPVTGIIAAITNLVSSILDAAINSLPSRPASPFIEFLQGALLLVRRSLFPVSPVLGLPVSPAVGLNFSTFEASPPPSYEASVKIMSDLGVKSIRMYSVVPAALSAIQAQIPDARVSVAIPNSDVAALANDPSYATSVLQNLKPYNSIVKTIVVGNEVDAAFGNNLQMVTTSVKNMQDAIAADNLPIDVTVSFTMGIVVDSFPPSASKLNPNLTGLTQLLGQLKSFAEVDIYPLFTIEFDRTIPLDYGLGLPTSAPVIDNGVIYHSLFWAEYDAVLWAFKKAGINLPVYVGETGWATNSVGGVSPYSTVENAHIYNQNLVTSMLTTGSPAFGVKEFPFYLFEFSDENLKAGGLFEPYWGWYAVTGGTLSPKYSLTLSAPSPTSLAANSSFPVAWFSFRTA